MSASPNDWHLLFDGYLSDMPGRSESWTESVRYLGRGAWRLVLDSTDFLGHDTGMGFSQRLSTEAMLRWATERDAEGLISGESSIEGLKFSGTSCLTDHEDPPPDGPGPRTLRLLEIAEQVGAAYCARRIRALVDPERAATDAEPTLKAVTGVALRPVWKTRHVVYTVETSTGTFYLYPPESDGTARLVQPSAGSMSMGDGTRVKLSKKWTAELAKWRHAWDELAASTRAPARQTG